MFDTKNAVSNTGNAVSDARNAVSDDRNIVSEARMWYPMLEMQCKVLGM